MDPHCIFGGHILSVLSWICIVLVGGHALGQFISSMGMPILGMICVHYLMSICNFHLVLLFQHPYIHVFVKKFDNQLFF
jgi:hypothetical protein